MAKSSWFSLLKRFFFITETAPNRTKARKKKGRWIFGKHRLKRLSSLPLPTERPLEEHLDHKSEGLGVADTRALDRNEEKENKERSDCSSLISTLQPSSSCQCDKEIEISSAIKIQTAFRGFLARKALRALKGLVKLQAIIRGRLVRRQAVKTLKRLQSIVNIQSQVCAKRIQMVDCFSHNISQENEHSRGKDIKIDVNSQKRWDDSILTKEEENAMLWSKREAAMKRDRIKEYAFNHRMSSESEQSKVNGKWRYWLEQWVDTQLAKGNKDDFEDQKAKLRNLKAVQNSTFLPRRSLNHRKQRSIGEEDSISMAGSPVIPTYMAATESARAKARSLSSPRLRPISIDTFSETNSPYKHKLLSPISSINSDATSSSRLWNGNGGGGFSQRSPSLKGVPGPVKSNRTFKDTSFNTECSLPNWDQYGHFR